MSNEESKIYADYQSVYLGNDGYQFVQLLLNGKSDLAFNNGSESESYKLKIEGYKSSNDFTIYPIHCEDENGNVDFSIKNKNNKNPLPTMYFAGKLGLGTNNPTHNFHVKSGDAVGLFESEGKQAYLRFSTNEGFDNRVEIANRPGGRLTLWTSGAGDAFSILKTGQVGIGTVNPKSALSIASTGKKNGPDSILHITNDCILFGGPNNNRELNSAQISAGLHKQNSLCIVGMSDESKSHMTRKVSVWAEAGLSVYGKIGLGVENPQAAISIASGGKKSGPDSTMHITNDCILFGGPNSNRELNSAQISAGLHKQNSLCIVGMSDESKNHMTRKVSVWAEGGLHLYGKLKFHDQSPVLFREYKMKSDNPKFNTNVSVNQWSAAIVGIYVESTGAAKCQYHFMFKKDNTWWIRADVVGPVDANWKIQVMFINTAMVKDERS